MCGIFGYAGNISQSKLLYEFMCQLAYESEVRGVDSTGFAARYDSGHVVVDKMPYRASVFTDLSHKFRRMSSKMPSTFIGHTRLGTGSTPSVNNNNHPFIGERFHMVHNGVIPSWRDIVRQHQLTMHSETDSEVVLRLLEKKQDELKLARSVEWILDNVWGNMAIALLEKSSPNIWLFRNENPIHVFIPDADIFGGQIHFFCSTKQIFDKAWKEIFGQKPEKMKVSAHFINDNHLFKISTKGEKVNGKIQRYTVRHLDVKKKFQAKRQYYGSTVGVHDSWGRHSTSTATSSFFSKVVDTGDLSKGTKFTKKDAKALRDILKEKGGKNKVVVDSMHINQYASLKALMTSLERIGESIEANRQADFVSQEEAKESAWDAPAMPW